jgi:hypothetical protein
MLALMLMVWSPGTQNDAEIRRQQQEIQRLASLVAAQEQETEELWAALEAQSPPCTAEMTALNPSGTTPDGTRVVRLDVVTTVSSPVSRCLPSTLSVTVSYLDEDGNLVCSGTASAVAVLTGQTGYISLEVQPRDLVNSVRWVNQPPQTDRGFQRVACESPDGLVDITTLPERLGSLWVRLSLFPDGGGLAVSDFRVPLS